MNLTKTHVNIVILEVILLVAAVTAFLLKEVTARLNVNVLPEITATSPEVTVKDVMLPAASRIAEIREEQKPKPQEITIELDGTPPPSETPSQRSRRDAPRRRQEKPVTEEFTFELE